MPFYEYQCSACGAQVEVLQKISDAPLRKCSECGKNQLKKLVSAPVFRLKGSGWYETDFKSDKDNKRNLVESDRDAPAAKEDKPAEKTEAPAADKVAGKGDVKSAVKAEGKSDSGASTAPARAKPVRRAAKRKSDRSVAKKPAQAKAKR